MKVSFLQMNVSNLQLTLLHHSHDLLSIMQLIHWNFVPWNNFYANGIMEQLHKLWTQQ